MLTVKKSQVGNVLTIHLSGEMDERVHLSQLIGPTPAKLTVNCLGISRINSIGVKHWVSYFETLKGKTEVTLQECSFQIVEQMNMIKGFIGQTRVESINLPFLCGKCGTRSSAILTCAELKKSYPVVPKVECPKCKAFSEFDDSPEEYLSFLKPPKPQES